MINSMYRVFALSKNKLNTLPLFVRNSKIMEEVGEFSEAVMFQQGYLPHKNMKEPLEGEAADVIICVLDTLAAAYPDKTVDELVVMLSDQLSVKCEKWVSVMTHRYNSINDLNALNNQYRRTSDAK